MSLLRLVACGSVDDGKSTLLGRLMAEAGAVYHDQLLALQQDSAKFGNAGAAIDYALLLDGLLAEREQGITIDVAYRYFAAGDRRFIIADCPGHEQYTRNMVTGASNADLAILLVDARKGLQVQTRRHAYLVHLLGIRQIILAVNKMDLVGNEQAVFDAIEAEFSTFSAQLGNWTTTAIPLCATEGDNIAARSARMPWYCGPTLLDTLRTAPSRAVANDGAPARLPVQAVIRPHQNFRGYAGTVAHGRLRVGDAVIVQPNGGSSRISAISVGGGDCAEAMASEAVVVQLADEIDVSRGDVVCHVNHPAQVTEQVMAHLVWFGDEALLPGRQYDIKLATQTAQAQVTHIKHRIDVNSQAMLSAKTLSLNDIGVVNLFFSKPLVCSSYLESRVLGGFILIDRASRATVAAGLIDFGLRRGDNLHWQRLSIGRAERAAQKHQIPRCIWLTGLSGSGKSTLADHLDEAMWRRGMHSYVLDGDNLRHRLNKDLGFTPEDRVENIRRAAEVARLMVDAGLIVIVSTISPYRLDRRMAREMFAPGEFIEVFVNTPLEECERRDPKGLYAKARRGELKNFTGIEAPYEVPEAAEIIVSGAGDLEANTQAVLALLKK